MLNPSVKRGSRSGQAKKPLTGLRLSVRIKLFGGFALVMILLAAMGAVSLSKMNEMGDAAQGVRDHSIPGVVKLAELGDYVALIENQVQDILIEPDASSRDSLESQLKTIQDDMEKARKGVADSLNDEKEKQMFAVFTDNWDKYLKEMPSLLDARRANVQADQDRIRKDMRTMLVTSKDMIHSLIKYQEDKANRTSDSSVKAYKAGKTFVTLAVVTAVLLSAAIALVIGYGISAPVKKLASAVRRVADGDLTVQEVNVRSRDEIGQLVADFNIMTANLRNLIEEIQTGADRMAVTSEQLMMSADQSNAASRQIAESIGDVAESADLQASASAEAAQAVDEMVKGMSQVAASMETVTHSSADMTDKVAHGSEMVGVTIERMRSAEAKVLATADEIAGLNERTQKIDQMVASIAAFSRQTNILSLNAGIEASRSGEAGRSFRIIANEIRHLADQSSAAAAEIQEMVDDILNQTKRVVAGMEEGKEAVAGSMQTVVRTGEAFDQIFTAIGKVKEQTEEVSAIVQQVYAGTQVMAASSERISKASAASADSGRDVSAAVEEQHMSMEEIDNAVRTLGDMAQRLKESVAAFKLQA